MVHISIVYSLLKDKAMELNDALFATNGRCGYVLKPRHLTHGRLATIKATQLTIKVVFQYFIYGLGHFCAAFT
jgi:hypothetical protein